MGLHERKRKSDVVDDNGAPFGDDIRDQESRHCTDTVGNGGGQKSGKQGEAIYDGCLNGPKDMFHVATVPSGANRSSTCAPIVPTVKAARSMFLINVIIYSPYTTCHKGSM